eukprot:gene5690-6574_t
MTTANITRVPWVENYYVGDGVSSLFSTRKASAFTSCPTPKEERSINDLKVSQQTIISQQDYSQALSTSVTASASVLCWKVGAETSASFALDRDINANATHFMINNYLIKSEHVFKREQLDKLTFSPLALTMLKEQKYDEFKEMFGDSFIVGYGTGGNYNADICIESSADRNTTDMQTSLSASFSGVAFTVNGAVDFSNKLSSYSSNYKITVTIQGTGIALKTIAIGDINQMVKDAGSLESLGDARLYAIISSYDDLPQFKAAVAGAKVDIQPKVRPEFAANMNDLYHSLVYAIKSKQSFIDLFTLKITNPASLASAKTKLNDIISQLQECKKLFGQLTIKNIENMSASPSTNKKWQSIVRARPLFKELEALPQSVIPSPSLNWPGQKYYVTG